MPYDREHFSNPPVRRIAGQGVLIHPDRERVLTLDMIDRPCPWIPGGHADPDEAPHAAVRRLVALQLSIDIPFTGADLALVDYSPATPSKDEREGYNFVFGFVLTAAQAGMARPAPTAGPDLRGYHWRTLDNVALNCADYHVRRITQAFNWTVNGGSAHLTIAGKLAA